MQALGRIGAAVVGVPQSIVFDGRLPAHPPRAPMADINRGWDSVVSRSSAGEATLNHCSCWVTSADPLMTGSFLEEVRSASQSCLAHSASPRRNALRNASSFTCGG